MEPREMVEKIAEKEFPQEAVERIYPAEGGFAHDTFFIEFENESFVVKINGLSEYTEKQDRDWNAGFETEPYVLDLILEDTDVPVPEPVARHTSKTVIPEYYHVLRKMEGYAPTKSSSETNFRDLGQDKKKNILEEIGRNIANIQHIEFKKIRRDQIR